MNFNCNVIKTWCLSFAECGKMKLNACEKCEVRNTTIGNNVLTSYFNLSWLVFTPTESLVNNSVVDDWQILTQNVICQNWRSNCWDPVQFFLREMPYRCCSSELLISLESCLVFYCAGKNSRCFIQSLDMETNTQRIAFIWSMFCLHSFSMFGVLD